MPRLRAAPRHAGPIPKDASITVDVPPELLTDPGPIAYGSSVAQITQTSSAFTTEPQIRVAPAIQPVENDETEDDPKATLAATEKRARDRIQAAERSAAEAIAWAQKTAATAAQTARSADEANLDSIANAITAANAEAEAAQNEIAGAMQRGDWAAFATAQRKLAKAESRISTLEAGHAELEENLKKRPAIPAVPAPPPAAAGNVEAVLAQMPNLNDAERSWIRDHPDSLMNPTNQRRMQQAYLDAQEWGIARGSKEYFDLFNQRLGYARQEPDAHEEEEPSMVEQPRRVAAPPSRGGGVVPSATGNSRRIFLTPEQREMARMSGVSEVDYAAGVVRLMEAKKSGMYPNG